MHSRAGSGLVGTLASMDGVTAMWVIAFSSMKSAKRLPIRGFREPETQSSPPPHNVIQISATETSKLMDVLSAILVFELTPKRFVISTIKPNSDLWLMMTPLG